MSIIATVFSLKSSPKRGFDRLKGRF